MISNEEYLIAADLLEEKGFDGVANVLRILRDSSDYNDRLEYMFSVENSQLVMFRDELRLQEFLAYQQKESEEQMAMAMYKRIKSGPATAFKHNGWQEVKNHRIQSTDFILSVLCTNCITPRMFR